MSAITQKCKISGQDFLIDDQDQAYYKRIAVPLPTLSPNERQRRRMSFRNERNLYHRKCDLCSKQIISVYRSESPYTVYCNSCWWSDKWDPLSYGQAIDFSRPFFEQFQELHLKVPRLALHSKNNENSDFTNHTESAKDCYLCVDTGFCQNVYYSKWMIKCQDCMDCHNVEECELCYEGMYEVKNYNTRYTFCSDGAVDCSFLYYCVSCRDCFMCSNLYQKQYCVYNKQLTQQEYEAFMSKVDLGSYQQLEKHKADYLKMIKATPKKANLMIMCENCTGGIMYHCKNVFDSFEVIESQDSRYCYDAGHLKDCYDVYESAFECELQYDSHACNRSKFIKFCNISYDLSNSQYCDLSHNSQDLFGCISLRHKQYCILNKHYSKEEYTALRAKLIEHMKQSGQYGEFFPGKISPFAYNETIAQEYYPLTKEQALKLGHKWLDDTEDYSYQGPIYQLPDNIKDTPDDVTKAILRCETSGKLYKIIPQELDFYRKMNLALPRVSHQQRYLNRLQMQHPRHLYDHICSGCKAPLRTPHDPRKEAVVYCDTCYVKLAR